ncbi:MAG TPA: hypothetical protein VHG51_07885 [Longimicrobiaceae bacterium]|nr:hypothetical protein [Longimicrobiaceae bacterium]
MTTISTVLAQALGEYAGALSRGGGGGGADFSLSQVPPVAWAAVAAVAVGMYLFTKYA